MISFDCSVAIVGSLKRHKVTTTQLFSFFPVSSLNAWYRSACRWEIFLYFSVHFFCHITRVCALLRCISILHSLSSCCLHWTTQRNTIQFNHYIMVFKLLCAWVSVEWTKCRIGHVYTYVQRFTVCACAVRCAYVQYWRCKHCALCTARTHWFHIVFTLDALFTMTSRFQFSAIYPFAVVLLLAGE